VSETPPQSKTSTKSPDDLETGKQKAGQEKKKVGWGEIFRALKHRKSLAMYILGMSAGLPYVLITGTLLAWLTEIDIPYKTIGVFSWTAILLGFKFLWSPAIDRAAFPSIFNMGQRRAGILLLQSIIILMLIIIALSKPSDGLVYVAAASVLCTVAFASQDILIDAWRIEVADDVQTVDVLSAVYQVGYRTSAILGGAGALFIAARLGWQNTFLVLVCLMAFCMSGVFLAVDSPVKNRKVTVEDGAPPAGWRNLALLPILISWTGSIIVLFSFMIYALSNPDTANASVFTRETGPWIIFFSIILPVGTAAYLAERHRKDQTNKEKSSASAAALQINKWREPWHFQRIFDALYGSILVPMMDLVVRLRFGAILVLFLVLSYRFVDLVWGAFAYPFYLGENFGALGHTLDEVAIASKIFGSFMTAFGIVAGGIIILRIGRMPSLFIGAVIAAATNLLYADLAIGAPVTDKILSAIHLYGPIQFIFQPIADFLNLDVNVNNKLVQLMMVIAAENLAVGFASAAIVVYLSSIVNPKYAAVQYALLASLSMLVGTLGRGWLGDLIEEPGKGFHYVFVLTAVLGCIAVVLCALEWWRQNHEAKNSEVK